MHENKQRNTKRSIPTHRTHGITDQPKEWEKKWEGKEVKRRGEMKGAKGTEMELKNKRKDIREGGS